MSVEVVMPRQGNTVESCIILSWKKRKGDRVKAGETLCEVETDKATFEVEAPADGTLLEVLFEEGADVAVLTPIAIIGDPSAGAGSAPPSAASAPATRSAASGASGAQVSPAAPHRPAAQSGGETARKRISPRARRLAESEGLEYGGLSGSGPGGRILERDVRDALASGARSAAAASPPSSSATPSESAGGEEIALTGVRRLTARRMHESLSQTAQLTLFASADARALLGYRKRLKAEGAELGLESVNINDLLLFAAARTLSSFPEVNAHFLGDKIVRFTTVNLSFAVDTPRGLLVPVIKNAGAMSLSQLSAQARRLAEACRDGRVSADDLSGGTFTLTNLGSFGVGYFTPILNTPQAAILGVGSIELKPVQTGAEVTFVPHINLSLTIDHQAVDGAPGARFLKKLAENIARIDLLQAL